MVFGQILTMKKLRQIGKTYFHVIIVSQQKFTTFEVSFSIFFKRKRVHAMIFILTLLSLNLQIQMT
jgi:hypothetical protein